MKALLSLTLICILLAPRLTHAGSVPVSTSSVNGYFLGYPEYAYIAINNTARHMAVLLSICKARGQLWALGVDAKFACTSIQRIEDGENGPVYELKIASNKPIRATKHALLYSTRPFGTKEWAIRTPKVDEANKLQNAPDLNLKKYTRVLANIRQGKSLVVDPTNGKLKIFILPWKTTDDGIVEDKDFVIAVLQRSGVLSIREARGSIVGYADLDGDGVPELQNSMNCDGTCESMISVTRKNTEVVYINNH